MSQPLKKRLTYQDMAQAHEYENHLRRLREQKSCIDNRMPYSCQFTRQEGHYRDIRREKQIEYDNAVLVRNMCRIMEEGSGVDNKPPHSNYNKAIYLERARQHEKRRIADENTKLLQRLERTQSTYKKEKFDMDRMRNEVIAERISIYPYKPMDRTGYKVRSRTDL